MDLTNPTTHFAITKNVNIHDSNIFAGLSQLSISKSESTILNRRANIKIRIPLVEM
jgi:hypothetical protein